MLIMNGWVGCFSGSFSDQITDSRCCGVHDRVLSKSPRHPRADKIYITPTGVGHCRRGKEMRVIKRERSVVAQLPIYFRIGLAADVAGVARSGAREWSSWRRVNCILDAMLPKEIKLSCECDSFCKLERQ